MASLQDPRFLRRQPRHAVNETAAIEVRVERPSRQPPSTVEADLLDFSREGFQLRVPVPLADREGITLRLRSERAKIDLTLPGTVRWQKPETAAAWLVGCAVERPTPWETLGELFLSGILSQDPQPLS